MKNYKYAVVILLVLILASACQNVAQTVTPTNATIVTTLPPTATSTFIPTATPHPTNTPTSTPIPLPTSLVSQIAPICELAFSGKIINKPLPGPVMVMKKNTYETNAQWQYSYLLPYHTAQTATDVKSIFCIQEARSQTVSYNDKQPGYRLKWDIRVVEFPSGDVLASQTLNGETPPRVKFNSGPGYGRPPTDQLVTWVMKNIEDKTVFFIGESVTMLTFSMDNEYLAVANGRRNNVVYSGTTFSAKIFIINIATGEITHTLTGHTDSITHMAISSDGRLLVSSSMVNAQTSETLVKIWDMKTGRNLHSIKIHGIATELTFSSDNNILAVSFWDKTPLINVATGKIINDDDPASNSPYNYLFGEPGWEAAQRMHIIDPNSQSTVNSSLFILSPNGNFLAEGSKSGFIKIWTVP